MRTLVLSDLHLGAGSRRDVLRRPDARERLESGLAEAARVVLLGDALELREAPVGRVLEAAGPALDVIARATSGRSLVVVPGNHDHQLAAPWLERLRLAGGEGELGLEQVVEPEDAGVLGWLRRRLPDTDLRLAYPGLWLRPDVYATHGHYLDIHLTIPRLEAVAAATVARLVRGRRPTWDEPGDYEHALSPVYSLLYAVAQDPGAGAIERGSGLSREVWQAMNNGRRSWRGVLAGRVAIPAAVAALNAAGLGPFRSEISARALRRSGLAAMAEVARSLSIDATHVVFGHTHRPGPLANDDHAEWQVPHGPALHNTGSWYHEPALQAGSGPSSPYWPGTCIVVEDQGPPEVRGLLGDIELD